MDRSHVAKILAVLVCVLTLPFLAGCSTTAGGVRVGVDAPHPGPSVRVEAGSPHHRGGPPSHAPAHGYRRMHTYRYYPDADVYFDISRDLYFYLEHNGWRISASLPHDVRVRLGRHVTIELDTDVPYRHSKKHKEKYKKKHKKKHKGKYPPGQMKKKW